LKRRGRKSAAQTPAPQKERVYGSSKNPVGSAASKTSASKIQLSDSIVKTLEDKRNDFNDNHPTKKVSLATLKAVMRRGMGAYSKSHRPTITGGAPNSRQAWGFARVNKFLKKYAGQTVKAAYVQDDDLMKYGGKLKEVVRKEKYVYLRFGLPNSDEKGNYFNSNKYIFGQKAIEEGGISVFEALKIGTNYYVFANNSNLRTTFDELMSSKRDVYLVDGEWTNNEGADDDILLDSKTFKVLKKNK